MIFFGKVARMAIELELHISHIAWPKVSLRGLSFDGELDLKLKMGIGLML
jgi:hypothetical protein